MISIGATAKAYAPLSILASSNQVGRFFRAEDPEVLERDVNPTLMPQVAEGRYIGGLQLAGAGKGLQFCLSLFMTRETPNLGPAPSDENADGLRLFFYKGETPEAISNSFAKAQQRIEAWAPTATWTRDVRAWELAGASDGLRFMGVIVVYRTVIEL